MIPKEMKLKCRSLLDDEVVSQYESLIKDKNQIREEVVKEFMSKNFIKFYINLYKAQVKSGNEERYMLDIHLFKGTGLLFMDKIRKFIAIIEQNCSVAATTNPPSQVSSPHLRKFSKVVEDDKLS